MPRSYSFDHFQSKNPIAEKALKRGAEQDKRHLHELEEVGDTDLHYGKKFSETEDILAARRMEHELEELAGVAHAPTDRAPRRPQKREAKSAQRGQPIGALPVTEEQMPLTLLRDLWDEASRQLRTVGLAARDVTRASVRLVTLPLRAAQLAARKVRPQRG